MSATWLWWGTHAALTVLFAASWLKKLTTLEDL
jgi:hypothetical protein